MRMMRYYIARAGVLLQICGCVYGLHVYVRSNMEAGRVRITCVTFLAWPGGAAERAQSKMPASTMDSLLAKVTRFLDGVFSGVL